MNKKQIPNKFKSKSIPIPKKIKCPPLVPVKES